MTHAPRLIILLTATATLAVCAGPATAQSIDVQVGGAAVVSPKYEGSKEYEVRGFPIIAPAGGSGMGPVQFRGLDDVRLRLLDTQGFEAGVLGGYRFGRDEDDADRLEGLGNVDGGLVAGGYAAYSFGAFKPYVSYHHQVTGGDGGAVLRLGAEARMPLTTAIAVTAIAGTTWANEDYMASYFSVTAAQALTSGLGVHDAGAGIKDVFIGIGTDVPFSDVWSLKLGLRYTHLLGDAADSPIVETSEQLSGLVGLSYKFNVSK